MRSKTMKKLLLMILCVCASMGAPMLRAQDSSDASQHLNPERHVFTIKNFHTEGGVTLPEAHIVYGTYGHLNAAHDNAILLPSHYMADHSGYEWLIGPGKV